MADRPAAVLVDGYNVLHAIPRFAPRGRPLAPARALFQAWLAQAARRRGVRDVVLVWDGAAGSKAARAPAPLTVLYAPSGTTADERLLELCRGEYAGRASATWVVSSDRGVQDPARELGFTALGAMTFYRRWSAAHGPAGGGGCGARGSQGAPGPERDPASKPVPTRQEVESLLAEFEAAARRARGEESD